VTILRSGSATDVGRVRLVNEDQALEGVTLFAVADGMGGHAGGDVAAQIAIDALQQRFGAQPSPNGLVEAVHDANDAVWQRSNTDPELRGMGTTLTAIGMVDTGQGDHLVLTNVGDSRAYRYRGGALEQLTVDHSVAEELVARGELSPAEAEHHPHRHILTRALGVGPEVDVDVWEVVPEQDDRLLLCSDGLTNELSPDQIVEVLSTTPDPQEAAEELVVRANVSGGNDNITVVLVDVLVADDANRSAAAGSARTGTGVGAAIAGVSAVGASIAGVPASTASDPQGNGARHGVATLSSATISAGAVGGMPPQVETPPSTGRGRRRGGPRKPRRVTMRVILFVLLVAGLAVGAWYLIRWYSNASYYVALQYNATLQKQEVVIYQGRPGGVLGLKPKAVVHTGITLDQVPPAALLVVPNVKGNVEESSLLAAKAYVHGLKCQANLVTPVNAPPFPNEPNCPVAAVPPASTTTTVPGGPTTTTVKGVTTTTAHAMGRARDVALGAARAA
jgi:PPM family protein phosphatase